MNNKDFEKILTMMFHSEESVCVSPNQYAFHSVPVSTLLHSSEITLVSNNSEIPPQSVGVDVLRLLSLNPIHGFRSDKNCTAYRSFLVELDDFTINQQVNYIKSVNVPYSAMIYSGGKSVHTVITLDTDLADEQQYRNYSTWILNILGLADQSTKNPSRSTRIPGQLRENGTLQELVDFKNSVPLEVLNDWLNKFPHLNRTLDAEVFDNEISKVPDPNKLPKWILKGMHNGFDFSGGRNNRWMLVGVGFAKAGISFHIAKQVLEPCFKVEWDFSYSEWERALNGGYKTVFRNYC